MANVCLPASCAGPRPSKNSVNWLSDEIFTPGKIRLWIDSGHKISKVGANGLLQHISLSQPANQQLWWWHEVDHHIQIDFYSTYFPGFAFSPSSVVSRLGCRVILLFISMAKPVSTLRWIASRTGFFFLPSSENYNKGKRKWGKNKKRQMCDTLTALPLHSVLSPSRVDSWSWSCHELLTCIQVESGLENFNSCIWSLDDTGIKPDFIQPKDH